jgi:hypothetical protein
MIEQDDLVPKIAISQGYAAWEAVGVHAHAGHALSLESGIVEVEQGGEWLRLKAFDSVGHEPYLKLDDFYGFPPLALKVGAC